MATSKVAIANLALQKIGGKRISSFTEDLAEARAVSVVYDSVRDEVLEEHPWTFAQKRQALSLIDETPVMTEDGVIYVYAKPTDMIKLNFTNKSKALVKIESSGILCDTTGLKILYTYRNDDPITYTAKFTMALAGRLAIELCFNLTESAAKTSRLREEYSRILLPAAVASDSQQGTPVQAIQDEWEVARVSGGLIAQSGSQTWHPLS